MSTPPNNLPQPAQPGVNMDEIRSMVRNMLQTDNAQSKVVDMMTDNFELREKNRQLKAENEQYKTKIPTEGAIVLTGDDAKLYTEFVALKVKPADITKLQADYQTLQGKVSTAERKEAIATAAKAEGYDATVLGTLVGDLELAVKSVTEDVGGQSKAVDRAFVRTKGADNTITEQRLAEYVEKNHAKFLPSLTVVEGESEGAGSATGATIYPRQQARAKSGKPAEANASKAYLQKRYRQKSAQGAEK